MNNIQKKVLIKRIIFRLTKKATKISGKNFQAAYVKTTNSHWNSLELMQFEWFCIYVSVYPEMTDHRGLEETNLPKCNLRCSLLEDISLETSISEGISICRTSPSMPHVSSCLTKATLNYCAACS